jgi:hypothetical protein
MKECKILVFVIFGVIFLTDCSSKKAVSISVLQTDLEWGWPDSEIVSVELIIKNDGSERVAGKAEVRGSLDLTKLAVYKMAQNINQSGLDREAFQRRIEMHPNGGSDLTEISKSILMLFEKGWVQDPVQAVVDIPLDDEKIKVFEFRSDVNIDLNAKATQIVVFDVAIPKKYSHRKAEFQIKNVHVSGE